MCVIAVCLYGAIAAALYIFQERLIFLGEPLDKNFKFSFENSEFIGLVNAPENGVHLEASMSATQNSAAANGTAAIKFQEINIPFEGGSINGLKFSAAEPKGAILFFHGNFGDVSGWGAYGADFAALGYDFYIFDYPGYGKSDGKISSQQQLLASADAMSRYVLAQHPPRKLAMIGYSIGSGIAARQAAKWDAARLRAIF